jgi:hypothetical protein
MSPQGAGKDWQLFISVSLPGISDFGPGLAHRTRFSCSRHNDFSSAEYKAWRKKQKKIGQETQTKIR